MLYGLSRLPNGLTQARYPGRDVQVIAPFALWWIGMVYDYALWRSDPDFVAALLPGHLTELAGEMVHPRGQIAVELHFATGHVHGSVVLPAGLHGSFSYAGKTIVLRPSTQAVDL